MIFENDITFFQNYSNTEKKKKKQTVQISKPGKTELEKRIQKNK